MMLKQKGFKLLGVGAMLAISFVVACANVESSAEPVPSITVAETLYAEAGPTSVSIQTDVWSDTERDRAISVKLYVPKSLERPPVVIFSHGLGGSVEAAPYLGQHLASWGILAIHIQHPGSDGEVWRGIRRPAKIRAALKNAARDPKNSVDRFNDLHFVLDEIERRVTEGSLTADMTKVGMAGHSFGAHSVLAAAGRRSLSPSGLVSFKDPRVKAGVVLSPPAPAQWATAERYDDHFGEIDIPLLHITGSEDESPLDPNQSAEDRQIAFKQINAAPQYLIVFEGADHGVFGGVNRPRSPDWYPSIQGRVAQAGTVFFKAYLNEDARSQEFMNGGQFDRAFDGVAATDRKP